MEMIVPLSKFEEMTKVISCWSIYEKGVLLGLIWYQNRHFAITGGIGKGDGSNKWQLVWGCTATELELYKGELKPLPYAEHSFFNDGAHIGYNGMLVTYNKKKYVLGAPITFKPNIKAPKPEQLQLF